MPYFEPQTVPAWDRLRDLGAHLRELAQRVREAVAEAVGETLGRIARDAARQWLSRDSSVEPTTHYRPQYSETRRQANPWTDEDPWSGPEVDEVPAPTAHEVGPTPFRKVGRAALAGTLWLAGWLVRKKYPPLAALITAVAGVTVGQGWMAQSPALDVAEILTAHQAIASGADALDPN